MQGNNLWVPAGETASGLPRYLNQAGSLNVERGGWSWGAKFGDLNNDGWQDLYLTNGYVSANKGKSYWYDYGKIAGGLKGLIGDAVYWPPIGDQSLAGYQAKCVWLNNGGGFTDVGVAVAPPINTMAAPSCWPICSIGACSMPWWRTKKGHC